tara:strand:+ start:20001 stop:20585 length:585 start_codon:yes stop_codon:yes gene_type:complete
MACTIATGKARYCKVQPGGIDKVYIIDRFNANAVETLESTAGVLTVTAGLTSFSGTADTTEFFQFDTDPYLSSLNQSVVVNEGGGVGFQQDIELTFKGVYGAADDLMQSLSNGAWQIAVLDNTGTVYFCGLTKGMTCTGGTFGHNGDKALSDNYGYTMTFTALEVEPAMNCGALSNFTGQTDMKAISVAQLAGA